MTTRPYRILFVASHPVQYAAPIFRLLAKDPRVEIQVAYCGLGGAEAHLDPEFKVEVKWDIPLLDGYPWIVLPNRSPFGRNTPFFGFFNPGVWSLLRKGKFDAVVLFTGYICVTFWIALLAAKLSGAAVLFGTDAHNLSPRDHRRWKVWVKKLFWPSLFRMADIAIAPSSGTAVLFKSLGIPENRIALLPYCVNNDWWSERSADVDRVAVRAQWGIPEDALVVLFSAKLQPWKCPFDLLRAFARVPLQKAYLVFAGDGPQRSALESEAQSLGIAQRVRFLGFVNQSGQPGVYTSADIVVLPSEYEPFGLVVNEAMLCGRPVVVSDRVGARVDLVKEAETGYVFSCGDVDALALQLRSALADPAHLRRMGEAARVRMKSWSPQDYVDSLVAAGKKAAGTRSNG